MATAPDAVASRRGPAPRRAPRHPVIQSALDPVTVYALDVDSGRVVAGELVRLAAARHLDDLVNGPARGLTWDPDRAQHAIDFFPSALRHYKGRWGPRPGHPKGDPVVLEPWQEFIVGSLFGWLRADGTRRFRDGYVEIAKKNGKTLMAAGLALLLAFFDGEPGAEVYSAATKRDQAKLVWLDAVQMVRASPALRRRIKRVALNLSDARTASKFEPLGKDSDTDQGINVHAAIIDEVHVHKDRDVVDNIESATSSREQPLIVKITTAGVKRGSIWWELRQDAVAIVTGRAVDDSRFVYIATLDDGDDPFDEAVWPKANPNLGVSVSLATLREQAAVARRSPGKLAPFLRYRMNVPTKAETRAIDLDVWDEGADPPLALVDGRWTPTTIVAGDACYGGLDLASVRDLTALVLLFRQEDGTFDWLARFWCPEQGIDERSDRDGVPYRQWVADGYLIPTPGNVTDYAFIRREIELLAEKYWIVEIGYDKWNATQLATELAEDGATMVAIPQTYAGIGPAWRELEKAIIDGKSRHGGHPILRWMADNVSVDTDPQGNQKPSKAGSTDRIDGIVAGTMAMHRWMTSGEPQVWRAV